MDDSPQRFPLEVLSTPVNKAMYRYRCAVVGHQRVTVRPVDRSWWPTGDLLTYLRHSCQSVTAVFRCHERHVTSRSPTGARKNIGRAELSVEFGDCQRSERGTNVMHHVINAPRTRYTGPLNANDRLVMASERHRTARSATDDVIDAINASDDCRTQGDVYNNNSMNHKTALFDDCRILRKCAKNWRY